MPHAQSRPRKTVADYMALPDEIRYELIDGELYRMPSQSLEHQDVIGALLIALTNHLEEQGLGEVILSPMDVHLPSGDIVQPDLIYVSDDRRGILQTWVMGVPDLLIEVLSPLNADRDLIVKRGVFARNEVPEYWIMDPMERSIQLLRLEGDHYEPEAYLTGDAIFEPARFPGLILPLSKIFA